MTDLRSETLKLAANLPAGDPTRRKILAALSRQAGATFRDEYGVFLSDYATKVRDALMGMLKSDGYRVWKDGTNGLQWTPTGREMHKLYLTIGPSGGKTVVKYSMDGWKTKMESRNVTDMDAMAMAKWLWKNTPAYMKS